jgi:hypothetical protein
LNWIEGILNIFVQSSNIDHLWFMNFLVVVELIVCRWWCSFWWCARFYSSCQCYFYLKNIRTKLSIYSKLPVISFYMPEVVSSNPTHDEVYWIQYYVIKCDRSVVLLKPPRYNCNIVESGVKYDNPHFTKIFRIPSIQFNSIQSFIYSRYKSYI